MKEKLFTPYQIFVIAILAILQFTVILDFMVISPLGVMMLKSLSITTNDFGLVVSVYAFSAGASGLLAAGFADKFDRKTLLLFFYAGFLLGTVLCALAPTYEFLLFARIVTGLFGGVIGSVGFAIITDLFKMEVRGRVMGYVQMAFSASQVLGIPIGLYLAKGMGWHAPFWMIAGFGLVVGVLILVYLKPINEHLTIQRDRGPFEHLLHTVSKPRYIFGFLSMSLLATGGFMLMPFGSTFSTQNMGLTLDQLPMVYMITGVFSVIIGPIAGRMSDRIGKLPMFVYGSLLSMAVILYYVNLGITPVWQVCIINVVLFMAITARMIPASALLTAIPSPSERGAFMSVNSAAMQIAGGIAAWSAGRIVFQKTPTSPLEHYDTLGYVVFGTMGLMMIMMYYIDRMVSAKPLDMAVQAPDINAQAVVAEM